MKRHLPLFLSVISALSAPAEDKPTQLEHAEACTVRPHAEQLKSAVTASSLMGMAVKNPLDETLGRVADLVLDVESGRIVAVIVDTGGYLGTGS